MMVKLADDHDCKQEEVIKEIGSNVGDLSKDIKILCASNREVVDTMKQMTRTLTTHMIENREHTVKIGVLEKDQDTLFDRLRRLEDIKVPDAEKAAAKSRAVSESVKSELKLSLKNIDDDINGENGIKSSLNRNKKTIISLDRWKNRIAGGLVIVSLLWTVLIMWFFKKMTGGG